MRTKSSGIDVGAGRCGAGVVTQDCGVCTLEDQVGVDATYVALSVVGFCATLANILGELVVSVGGCVLEL